MAITEYVPTEWFDNTAPAINAANLNHIEQGIKHAVDGANAIDERVVQIENGDISPLGSWSFDGTTLFITVT